jgi:hypothetical protein
MYRRLDFESDFHLYENFFISSVIGTTSTYVIYLYSPYDLKTFNTFTT